ncbi:MAG: shikimate kinase [Desulfobulbaceae bacterium]|nr:shikimate kinase [Desulfobulbaceae bacterium]
MKKSNIVLIGMPGSGKSTVGVILAKLIAKRFLDTDILIQNLTKKSLQEIVDSQGSMALRKIEEQVLLSVRCKNHIIATGGSAAYSHSAMQHLKQEGLSVFLQADLTALKARIHNYETRGLAKRPEQTFQDLFEEREELYTTYADITVECSKLSQDQVADAIVEEIEKASLPGVDFI